LQSRRHWFSADQFRRRWMIFYLIFNGGLYVAQLILYACLFLSDQHGIFRPDQPDRLSLVRDHLLTIEYLLVYGRLIVVL
jgi:hypothetical protein